MVFDKIRRLIAEKNADIALFYNIGSDSFEKNIFYTAGYKGLGCLVVPRKKRPFMVVPLMEVERAKKTARIKVYEWQKKTRLFENVSAILKKQKIAHKKILLSYNNFGLDAYLALKKNLKSPKIYDISLDLLKIRAIKSVSEVAKIKRSCQIADEILKDCIRNFKQFKTESDVERFLHLETIRRGCELSFPTIVASGSSSSMPHYEPKNIPIKNGFCVIDFGVIYQDYHSDITRTIYLGSPSKEEIDNYGLLLNIQKKIISNIRIKKKCKESYEETLMMLREKSDNFFHGLGHGIGLDIHELPNITPVSEDGYQNNMVFTIEPGLYFRNKYGIRIEDDILIQDGRVHVLTRTPKDLIIIKRK